MPSILFIDFPETHTLQLLTPLLENGFSVTFARQGITDTGNVPPATLVVSLDDAAPIHSSTALAKHRGHWIAWNRTDDPALALGAYQAGAIAVMPAATTPDILIQVIRSSIVPASAASPVNAAPRHHRYHRSDLILPETNTVIDIVEGVVALTVIHHDGAQVLLGLCGAGQTLIGHPHDTCSLQLIAHTDTTVAFSAWVEAVHSPGFSDRLRARLQHIEAWAAMQARPHLDQRILGLLSLLAEQFGESHAEGILINVRLTHTQLASAANATRTTITRAIGDLRTRGLLTTLGSGDAERFCLRELELGRHPHQ